MADPAYFGDYPAPMRKTLGPLLPSFTPEQSEMLKGTLDYFAVGTFWAGGSGEEDGCEFAVGSPLSVLCVLVSPKPHEPLLCRPPPPLALRLACQLNVSAGTLAPGGRLKLRTPVSWACA
jgi:hypothetical protein